jgi:hypothetical protein
MEGDAARGPANHLRAIFYMSREPHMKKEERIAAVDAASLDIVPPTYVGTMVRDGPDGPVQ